MEYENALGFYHALGKFSHEPGLWVMQELCRRLSGPEEGRAFVHIAGTNGKGSCAAMTASILRAAGLRAGLYTSPDLTDMRERIQVDGVNITKEAFAALTERVASACDGLPVSFFEAVTALGFLYFAREGCGCTALECGLGGRFDATNVIETPACAVIMPIGLDHMAVLGDTLAKIAGEKAGIVKPGGTVVCAPQRPEALAVIEEACRTRGASLRKVDITEIHRTENGLDGQTFSYGALTDLHIGLLGAHQTANACAAAEAALALGLGEDAIRAGLAAARWPCRFELVRTDPPFILDGAHNPHGAASLAAGLREYFPGRKFVCLMGAMADKDYEGVLRVMEPLAERFVCCAPDDGPRALPAASLAASVRGVPATAAEDVAQAVRLCLDSGRPCCAFGSLYYIGRVRALLQG